MARAKKEIERIGGEFLSVRILASPEERHRLRVAAALCNCSVTELVRAATWEVVAKIMEERDRKE